MPAGRASAGALPLTSKPQSTLGATAPEYSSAGSKLARAVEVLRPGQKPCYIGDITCGSSGDKQRTKMCINSRYQAANYNSGAQSSRARDNRANDSRAHASSIHDDKVLTPADLMTAYHVMPEFMMTALTTAALLMT